MRTVRTAALSLHVTIMPHRTHCHHHRSPHTCQQYPTQSAVDLILPPTHQPHCYILSHSFHIIIIVLIYLLTIRRCISLYSISRSSPLLSSFILDPDNHPCLILLATLPLHRIMPRHPQRLRRQGALPHNETAVVSSFGLLCGVADTYRQQLLADLQSHLCKDTARLVYEYSVCDKPCSLRGRAGGKQCCSCRDVRPFNPATLEVTTRVYVDGKGYVMQRVPRSKWWCPQCRVATSKDTAEGCLLYTSPSPRDRTRSRMPSSA